MELFGLEKLSLVDFDGFVSATVFTGNCNFRCEFCHNATLVVDYNNLETISENEVLDYLKKRKGILEGLCVTGGEPTLQKDLPNFIEKVKKIGYSVKVDTNGTNPEMVKTLWENGLADYFAVDIKNNKDDYAKIIGFDTFDTKCIQKTIDYFFNNNVNYEFRTTLIEEYHKEENIIKIGEWIKGANKYFMQKFKNGENCLTHNLSEVPTETAKKYLEIIRKYIPNSGLRGYDL